MNITLRKNCFHNYSYIVIKLNKMSYNNQPDWEFYQLKIKEEQVAPKKKKFKIVIKPNFEEEFKKWNDFNTEWLKYYNFFRLRLRFNNKSVEEMKELCDTIGYEVLEKQKQSNILKTNTWCKTLLNMEAEEQNRTALKTYSILKKYDNQIKGIRKIIQKAVNTNMVN